MPKRNNKIKQCDCILVQICPLPKQENAIMAFREKKMEEEEESEEEYGIYIKEIHKFWF